MSFRPVDLICVHLNVQRRSLVSFGPKQRAIGEAAKTAEVSNYKNTVGALKRLIGRTLSDTDVQEIESKFVTAKLVDAQGSVGVEVYLFSFRLNVY